MNATAVALPTVLALASPAGGAAKFAGAPATRRDARRFGLPLPAYRLSETAAAAPVAALAIAAPLAQATT
ncbi:hypothetical protein ACQEU3_38215 [Spirillospora sp. CA-253888]